jgi:cell division transport system ATP-binding protein
MEDDVLIKYVDVTVSHDDQNILENVTFEVHRGEFVYINGRVGSGKSSLLKTLYHDLPVSEGSATIFEYDLTDMHLNDVPELRRRIGIVFQDFQLLSDRTVDANLQFVLQATGWKDKTEIQDRISDVLRHVGMSGKGLKMPHELSGGEQQRIVMARALLNSPDIILADEPTGNLDPETGASIVELLHSIQESGTTVVMSTHNTNLIQSYPGRVLKCDNGRLIE